MLRATLSRSAASANTSCGLLPPSSKVTGLTPLSALAVMIDAPVRVEPVNEILPIPGWRHKASPVTDPVPCTILKIPAGMPASIASCASRSTEKGVISDGFSTTALPAANAGPILVTACVIGKFQGAMVATTP